ncbi:N-acetyltransferase ESCO2 isoform X2 [Tachyglossus aculeatus]|uniref:N-acetyltransferase ESCO2 isoform X2 n=1 Tax=Tachyglossus aculeatus TaxID=9261 RepID=UPI0018F72579|nr:N-acetyltransferase ESCO2 isoform X2 [Tachyglossus aculeatus]XP_038607448.1 N-acetyltransferase ESCO2 isoform X2 [Tachyglossus aculeatus]XP_038607449.1 N-acetyltransferase ESCO2 isoform X2 [Tachyglossus aculeatus]
MATVTPRKRNRRTTNCAGLLPGNPMKKLILDFTDVTSPLSNVTSKKQISKASDETKENPCQVVPQSVSWQGNKPPFQTAFPAKKTPGPSPFKSSKPGSPYKSAVSTITFYNKENQYLNPLERKLVKESRSVCHKNNSIVFPVPSLSEKMKLKVTLSKKASSRIQKSSASRFQTSSRHTKTVAKNLTKNKENGASFKPVEKKTGVATENNLGNASHVLSLRVKPKVTLQIGAAFFATRKKSHPVPRKGSLDTRPAFDPAKKALSKEIVDADLPKRDVNKTAEASQRPKEKLEVRGLITRNESGMKQNKSSGSDCKTFPTRESASENSGKAVAYPIFGTPSTNKKRIQPPSEDLSSPGSGTSIDVASELFKQPHNQKVIKNTRDLNQGFKDQFVIDAGQKHFGATICKSCGMIYTAASPEDEVQHAQYHQRFVEGIKFIGWKKERIVAEFWDGKVIMVLPDDPRYAIRKAEDVRELVDKELGFKQVVLSCPSKTKTYLFVSNEKKVVGCLIAEQIKKAFRVFSEPASPGSPNSQTLERHRAWRCSSTPEAALCGISRIWVFSLMRRKGIAGRLMDVVRNTFMYGGHLDINEIAFSDPTPDGKLFATKYCNTPNFLVYNFIG